MGAARTARSGAIDTEMRAREGLREMNKAPTCGVNTLVARRPRGGMQSGQQTFLGWGRGKSAAQKFSPATARGTTVSSASDRELVRKFVRESILGDPEKYQVPYHLKPRKDPFAGEWDPDWVVLGGSDNDEQTWHSSAGGLVDAEAAARDGDPLRSGCRRRDIQPVRRDTTTPP